MKRLLIASAAFVLIGCQHTEPGIEVRTVQVPTPVPCLPADQIPAEPPLVGHLLTGDPAHDIAILAPSALLLRDALRQARAALIECEAE
jgi:hypothetical protein